MLKFWEIVSVCCVQEPGMNGLVNCESYERSGFPLLRTRDVRCGVVER